MKKSFPSTSGLNSFRQAVSAIAPMETKDFDHLYLFLQSRTVGKGELLLTKGNVCRNIFFLLDGFVRMYYIDFEGNEINYRFTNSGNFFVDFQSFLTQKPSLYYWEAMQDAELLQISYSSVQHLFDLYGKQDDLIILIISGLIPRGSASEKWVQGSTLGFNTFY